MNPPSAEQAILDAHYMARALELARNGLYTTHPNPRVGCALVPDGQTAAVVARDMERKVKAHAPRAKLDGFLIQKMERGLAEVILGFRRDPLVGPTVTVGLGGVLAEIYRDASTRLAPVDEAEALRGAYRGLLAGRRSHSTRFATAAALVSTHALCHSFFPCLPAAATLTTLSSRSWRGSGRQRAPTPRCC